MRKRWESWKILRRWPPWIYRWRSEGELCVGGEGKGEVVVWLVKFVWIRACVKAGLPHDPDHPDQQKCKPKEEWPNTVIACWMHFRSWKIACQCDFSTTSVSCWIITGNMDLLTSVDSLRQSTNTGVITTGKYYGLVAVVYGSISACTTSC